MIKIDTIIRSRRKTISISVLRDGTVQVRAPLLASDRDIYQVIEKKAHLIQKYQEEMRSLGPLPPIRSFQEGEVFWYLGRQYQLEWVETARPALQLRGHFLLSEKALPRAKHVFEHWYRQQALKIISERVALFSEKYKIPYRKIRISSARTRWGSCSTSGTLSFPWRLVMAPLPVIDSVVIHELVHVSEHNHQKKFWDKVLAIMPDYYQRKKWLDDNSQQLTL